MGAILRSMSAVAVGMLTSLIVLYATAGATGWAGSIPLFGAADMVITGARWLIASTVGGYATAATVRRAPIWHGVVSGGLVFTIIAYGVAWEDLDFFSPWFIDPMLVLVFVAAALGGYIRVITAAKKARLVHDGT